MIGLKYKFEPDVLVFFLISFLTSVVKLPSVVSSGKVVKNRWALNFMMFGKISPPGTLKQLKSSVSRDSKAGVQRSSDSSMPSSKSRVFKCLRFGKVLINWSNGISPLKPILSVNSRELNVMFNGSFFLLFKIVNLIWKKSIANDVSRGMLNINPRQTSLIHIPSFNDSRVSAWASSKQ